MKESFYFDLNINRFKFEDTWRGEMFVQENSQIW